MLDTRSKPRGSHWLRLNLRTTDDEGTPLRVDLNAARRLAASLAMPEKSWIFHAVSLPPWVLNTVGLFSVLVVLGFVASPWIGGPRSAPPLVRWLAALALLPFPLLVVWGCIEPIVRIRRARTRCIPAFKAASLCAGCHYSLRHIPADGQGLTRCPECGLAWRLKAPQTGC
ncbi:MAG: hypothetical protein K2Q09_04645 [Phycisphaerales bacterium]|nr:hypothetical protein [Phycisphaerales bacterium]